MPDTLAQTFTIAIYLLTLINPISKVSILSGYTGEGGRRLQIMTLKSSAAAAGILLGSMVFGDFILRVIFRVEIHSLNVAGGIVLCWVGFNALRKGVFFEQETQARFEDLALVPLACPMIAGPATITACITLGANQGHLAAGLPILLAIMTNHLIMSLSRPIGGVLIRFNIMGALIRITGLVVMTIGTQMSLDGLAAWLKTLG